ncbi:MAG: hypothetical protein KF847_18375 [Pirellulales bacterium]|nr:hypothetical protein [Pirellulales bacterium]
MPRVLQPQLEGRAFFHEIPVTKISQKVQFSLNGAQYAGSTATIAGQDVLSGTLADGTVFVFSGLAGDLLNGVRLVAAPLPAAEPVHFLVNSASSFIPRGLRPGQSLTLAGRAALGANFAVLNATLNVNSGTIGESLETVGSSINVSEGTIGGYFKAHGPGVVNVAGGSVGPYFGIGSGTTLNVTGGAIGTNFSAAAGSVVNIRGGRFGAEFVANAGSQINLFGSNFAIDGAPLEFNGSTMAIVAQRNVTLTGILADGTPFSYYLFTRRGTFGFSYFSPDAIVTVALAIVPEPATLVLVVISIVPGLAIAQVRRRNDSPRRAATFPGRRDAPIRNATPPK